MDEKDIEGLKPLFNFTFYMIEKVRKLRLLKEVSYLISKYLVVITSHLLGTS